MSVKTTLSYCCLSVHHSLLFSFLPPLVWFFSKHLITGTMNMKKGLWTLLLNHSSKDWPQLTRWSSHHHLMEQLMMRALSVMQGKKSSTPSIPIVLHKSSPLNLLLRWVSLTLCQTSFCTINRLKTIKSNFFVYINFQACCDHLKLPDQAEKHYRAVCRALFAEAQDLATFLAQISKGTKVSVYQNFLRSFLLSPYSSFSLTCFFLNEITFFLFQFQPFPNPHYFHLNNSEKERKREVFPFLDSKVTWQISSGKFSPFPLILFPITFHPSAFPSLCFSIPLLFHPSPKCSTH